jgi:hypothetical protein
MYANHSACWDAKNRFGLPDEMPFEFNQIAELFGDAKPVEATEIAEEKIEPMEPVSLPHLKPDAPATVETAKKVPKAKRKEPLPRPESMQSDDGEKDILLEKLWGMMQLNGIDDPLVLQAVVAEKDYYDLTVAVCDYDKDFISDVLIEAWDQVNSLCQTKIHDLPF